MTHITNYSNGSSDEFTEDHSENDDSIVVIKTVDETSYKCFYDISYTFEEFLATNEEFTASNGFERQFIKITSYETVNGNLCVKSFEMFEAKYVFEKPLKIFNKHHVKARLHHILKFNFDDSLVDTSFERPYVMLNPIRLNDKAIIKKYYDMTETKQGISKKLANKCSQYMILRKKQEKHPLTAAQIDILNGLIRNISKINPNILRRCEFMIWIC